MTTPAAIRAEVLTQLGITEPVLAQTGASRDPATDLARAVILRLTVDHTGLSALEAARTLGFRTAEAAAELLDRLDAGDYDASPALPGAYANAAALVTATQTALELEPL